MKKKLLAALVAVSLFAFVGCGSDDKSAQDQTEPETTQEEMTQEETTEPSSSEEETSEQASDQSEDFQQDSVDSPYSSVTALDADSVEAFAAEVKQAYVSGDWQSMSSKISYPVTVSGNSLGSADEFLSYMSDKTVDASSLEAMQNEDCSNMFVNGQGICMGDGNVWFLDVNNDGIEQKDAPDLRVISINGVQ